MQTAAAFGEVFNVGSTEELSILEFAERVRAATDSSSEITLVPYEEAYEEGFEDMHRRIPDTSKVRDLLGWEPTMSLDEILTDVIEWQRLDTPLVESV
jgi:UDP-glucose 4-epimerase